MGLSVAGIILAPMACFYPNYTFDGGNSAGAGPGSGGGGGGGSGAGASPASTGEDCTNGVDDNGDGKVDCEDPGCGDYSCESEVPHEWEGFYALFEGKPGDAPSCPGAYPLQDYAGNGELSIPDPGCPKCTCGTPTGQNCVLQPAQISTTGCSVSPFCSGSQDLTPDGTCVASSTRQGGVTTCSAPSGNMCPSSGTLPCNSAIRVGTPGVTGGGCAASQTPKPLPLSWSKVALGCRQSSQATMGQGCGSSKVCVPKVPAPFQPNLCVKMAGEVGCPALYPKQHIYYDTFKDNRVCGGCSCGAPTGASCSTTIQFFSDSTCSTMIKSVTSGSCADLSGNPTVSGRKALGTTISPGSCAPSGGLVSGAATPDLPTTFCCK